MREYSESMKLPGDAKPTVTVSGSDPWMQWYMRTRATVLASTEAARQHNEDPDHVRLLRLGFLSGYRSVPKEREVGGRIVEMMTMESDKIIRSCLEETWKTLDEADRREIAQRMRANAIKLVTSSDGRIREILLDVIGAMADEEVNERLLGIRERVRAEVEAKWEAHVEKIVTARLTAAIEKIRAEMAGR